MSSLQGLYGAVFIKTNVLWSKFRRSKLSRQPIPIIEVLYACTLYALSSAVEGGYGMHTYVMCVWCGAWCGVCGVWCGVVFDVVRCGVCGVVRGVVWCVVWCVWCGAWCGVVHGVMWCVVLTVWCVWCSVVWSRGGVELG